MAIIHFKQNQTRDDWMTQDYQLFKKKLIFIVHVEYVLLLDGLETQGYLGFLSGQFPPTVSTTALKFQNLDLPFLDLTFRDLGMICSGFGFGTWDSEFA